MPCQIRRFFMLKYLLIAESPEMIYNIHVNVFDTNKEG